MKKRFLLIIVLLIFMIFLSSCSIFESYVMKGFNKILLEDGYKYSDTIDDLNLFTQNIVYKDIDNGNNIEYKNGSYLEKGNDVNHLYCPNGIKIDIYKNNENILISYIKDNNKYYIFKDLKTYQYNNEYYEVDNDDIIINYDNPGYRIILDDNNYYDVSEDYQVKEKFEDKRSYFVSSFFSDKGYYYKENDGHIEVYFISLKPSDYVYDLQSAYFTVQLINNSCKNNPKENKKYFGISDKNDIVVTFSLKYVGKENMMMTYVEIYDNQIKLAKNENLDNHDNWNENVINVLNNKFYCGIPYISLGYNYQISNDYIKDEEDDYNISDGYIKINDNHYQYLLNDYKEILVHNGFELYEPPINIIYDEKDNYNEWIFGYNTYINSEYVKYYDAYINEGLKVFIKLDYNYNDGNIIKIYQYNEAFE